jgi:5-methylcytosine-specific restriction endonuclease McrA
VRRGIYHCAGCDQDVPVSIKIEGKRIKNVSVDHINPVVDVGGFVDWNEFISRLYCELDNLQLLCKQCHDLKSKNERIKV